MNVLIIPEGLAVPLLLDVAAAVFVGAEDCAGQHRGLAAEVAEGLCGHGPYLREDMVAADYGLDLEAFLAEKHSHDSLGLGCIF